MTQLFIVLPLFVVFLLSGCDKPDPHPELRDPIVQYYEAKAKEAAADVESNKISVAEMKQAMDKVVPQTGQIKYAKKHYYEAIEKLEKSQQLKKYYEIKKKSQEDVAQDRYMEMYNKGTPDKWPDPEEFETFKQSEANRTQSRSWSVKKRIEGSKTPDSSTQGTKPGH